MPGIQIIYRNKEAKDLHVSLPTSKSMAARALVIAAAAGLDPLRIPDLPVCDDTEELSAAIAKLPIGGLKAAIATPPERPEARDFYLGSGGTSFRFFTALAASWPGLDSRLSCSEAMARRPVLPLISALRQSGAEISFEGKEGYPPLRSEGHHLPGGVLKMPGRVSSQFCTALMLVAPYWKDGIRIDFGGEKMVSFPYIRMTERLMRGAGAMVEASPEGIIVKPGGYPSAGYEALAPEPDWSAAAFFYAFALLDPKCRITFTRLTPPSESAQGDSRCAEIFDFVGVSTRYNPDGSATLICDEAKCKAIADLSKTSPLEFDMEDTPDMVPALAVALCLSGIRFVLHGVDHLRHKESDRLEALRLELQKVGYALVVPPTPGTADDFLRHEERIPFILPDDPEHPEANSGTVLAWLGRHVPTAENETIETHTDHRMAMSMALSAIKRPYISMKNPEVVDKSFPDYFTILADAGMEITPFGAKASRAGNTRKRSWREQLEASDRRLAEAARRQGLLTPEGEPVINRAFTSRHKSMKQFARELRRRGMRPPKAVTPPARLRPGHPTI